MKEWHCVLFGQPQGPFNEEQLREMIGRGEIARDTLVWSGSTQADAARGWAKASETELISLFSAGVGVPSVPPELPPMPPKLSFSDEAAPPAPKEEAAPAREEAAPQAEAQQERDPDSYAMEPLQSAMFMQAGGAQDAQAAADPQEGQAAPADPASPMQQPAGPVPASRAMRFCAFVLECVLSSLMSAAFLPGVILTARGSVTAGLGAMGLASLAFLAYCVFNLYCLYRSGQTIGKKMVGIRIVNVDGSRTPLWRILVLRYGIYFILSVVVRILKDIPLVGTLAAGLFSIFFIIDACFIFRKDRRTIHDHVAGTIVVKE